MHDDFVRYLLSIGEVKVYDYIIEFVYKTTNYLRDELCVYDWCLEYGDSFGGFSNLKTQDYEVNIRKLMNDFEMFRLYEINEKLTEEGYDKK